MKDLRLLIGGCVAAGLVAVLTVAGIGSGAFAGVSASDLNLITRVIAIVQQDYVHELDSNRLTQDALEGLLAQLDPHSSYMTEQEYRQSQQDLSGKFGGIGVEISDESGIPMVISPIDHTPAARAGLQPGDLIVSVDGQGTHGMDPTQVVSAIRGPSGSTVTLTIARGTQPPFNVTLNRSVIQTHTVTSKPEDDGIGYVRISKFEQATPADLKSALQKLKHDAGGQLKGLVLDLRDDPGGLLTSAVQVSGDFLNSGTIVSVRGRHRGDVFTAPAHGDLLADAPIAVLINGASASAAEIVAGALQDRRRAKVIGTQSFGKGSVQSIIPLNGHGALRLTTALYYTPSGRSIQDQGISPNIVVEAPKDEQAESGPLLRESQLHGAFPNPGPLANTSIRAGTISLHRRVAYSPPIKEQLIGTPQDAQLAAALDYLKHREGSS
jgi:carboxyl-terminal processing protease